MRPGRIVDTAGVVRGGHEGIANYTIGQRKRLPASGTGPLFVIALEPATNTVVVGPNEELFARGLVASTLNSIAVADLCQAGEWVAVSARIRYNGAAAIARIRAGEEPSTVECCFDNPQRAVTPGQAAVFYDGGQGDVVLGGGTIERAVKAGE
jgi:tRNA-uridine 2-sulfurtransferase